MGLGFRLPVQGANFQARDSGFEGVGVFSRCFLHANTQGSGQEFGAFTCKEIGNIGIWTQK